MDLPADVGEVQVAADTVAWLHGQADALRTEIAKLRQDLTEEQNRGSNLLAAELVEANSHLVLSALHAEEVAETAAGELDELTQTSQHDALTGALTRAVMLDRLANATTLARRHGTRVAVLFLDLDRFKEINDSLGHAVGDEVLQLVAKRLAATLRDSDTVSRYGGDEFLVLLPEVADATHAAIAATKVLLAIAEPSTVGGHTLHLSASVGVSIYPEDGQSAAQLITAADAALYRSKRHGRGGFALHSEALLEDAVSRSPQSGESASNELKERVEALRRSNETLETSEMTARELQSHATEERQAQIGFLTAMLQELRDHHAAIATGAEPVRARGDARVLIQLEEALARRVARLTP